MEELSPEERRREPHHAQEHWYLLLSQLVEGLTVLDVGAGTGYGLDILNTGAPCAVLGIDPLPVSDAVQPLSVSMIRDATFDLVSCFDVIEHVADDVPFFYELLRIARIAVFLSTPNWNVWLCQNKYHYREYTPDELTALIGPQECLCWTVGSNRIESPVRRIDLLQEADAGFGVLIRAPSCTDEQWMQLLSHAEGAEARVPGWLNSISLSSHEWESTARQLCAGLEPLNASIALLTWLKGQLVVRYPTGRLARTRQTIDVLRYGLSTPLHQAISIAWALNSFVLSPTGPYVNHAKVQEEVPDGALQRESPTKRASSA